MSEQIALNDSEFKKQQLIKQLGGVDAKVVLIKTKDNSSGVGDKKTVKLGDIDIAKTNILQKGEDILLQTRESGNNEVFKVEKE